MTQVIKRGHSDYNHIKPCEWESIFAEQEKIEENMAEILLDNESTAIYHINPEEVEFIGGHEEWNIDNMFCWIFPIHSENKGQLDYLAEEVLPKVFGGKNFRVKSRYVPGDCSVDCS